MEVVLQGIAYETNTKCSFFPLTIAQQWPTVVPIQLTLHLLVLQSTHLSFLLFDWDRPIAGWERWSWGELVCRVDSGKIHYVELLTLLK